MTLSAQATGAAQAAIEDLRRTVEVLEREVSRVIVGQELVVRGVTIALLAGGHVLLEGLPGLGKTLLVRTIARALQLQYGRVQFTPDLMPADILGTNVLLEAAQGGRAFQFQPGPIFANLVLADEINRATPKTQSALLLQAARRLPLAGRADRHRRPHDRSTRRTPRRHRRRQSGTGAPRHCARDSTGLTRVRLRGATGPRQPPRASRSRRNSAPQRALWRQSTRCPIDDHR
jgi:energy-coupling factor transporter ATP-binding protein EcfA2